VPGGEARAVIEARGLGRSWGGRPGVEGLDLDVARGEVVGLLGPNGAGKTTTMRLLVGTLAPTAGTVRLDGMDVVEDPLRARARVGWLPERPPLPSDATVVEAVAYAARLQRVPDVAGAVTDALARCGVAEVAARVVGHLSKGWRQRVGLAVATVHRPAALVLDEPSSGLDPAERVEMRARVRRLADGGAAVLLSSHVLAEVEAVCDRVVVLHEGRRVLEGRLDDLAGRDASRLVVRDAEEARRALAGVRGVRAVETREGALIVRGGDPADLATAAAPFGLVALGRADDLEAVFLRVTGGDR
jgi:ABC-2 type transport system ATP-binding protein